MSKTKNKKIIKASRKTINTRSTEKISTLQTTSSKHRTMIPDYTDKEILRIIYFDSRNNNKNIQQ